MEHQVAFYRVDPQAGSVTALVAQYATEREPERPAADDRVACLYCETTIGADGDIIVASSDTAYRVTRIDSAGRVMRVWQRSGLEAAAWTDAERRRLEGSGVSRIGSKIGHWGLMGTVACGRGRPGPSGTRRYSTCLAVAGNTSDQFTSIDRRP